MTKGKIVSWIKSEGDKLSKSKSVVVVESDKADMDVETFYEGYLAVIMVKEGNLAPVGSAIALLAETEDEIPLARARAATASSPASNVELEAAPPLSATSFGGGNSGCASAAGGRVIATPYAKKLAKGLKVELAAVAGIGPTGRIVAKDVEAAAAAPADVELGSVVPFMTMQGAVSRNMVESLMVPTFRIGHTITIYALDALYKKIKSKGVTMIALLAKATALVLEKHPMINFSSRNGKSFTYNNSINIAVALAIDGGLITPVLQDADKVDIYSLSRKWKELVDKARAK